MFKRALTTQLQPVFVIGYAIALAGHSLAQTGAPSAGTIFQQTKPQEALPTAPGKVIQLPPAGVQFDQVNTPINVSRFAVEGATLIPVQELLALLQDLPSKSQTLAVVNEALQRVTRHYQAKGYALAYAYVPPQTVKDGVVTLRLMEPRYDRIELAESSRLKPEQALSTVGVKSGEPVQQNPLDRGLLLLNQTPGVQVQGVLVPGAQPATTSLRLNIKDTPLFTGSVSANNHGNEATGRARAQFSANIDNPFGYGSQIALNGITTEGNLLQSTGVSYLSGDLRDGLRASLYRQQTHYRLGGAFAALGQTGWAEQTGAALSYPLVLTPSEVLNIRLDAMKARYASTSSTLDSAAHTDMLRLGLAGARTDNKGGGSTSGSVTATLGNQGHDTVQSRQSDDAGAKTAGSFRILQFQIQRDQALAQTQWLLQAGINGQVASKNLDSSQKFYLGGPYGVMSAPASELAGDQGAIIRVRLAHPLPLPQSMPGRLEAALLLQSGTVQINRDPFSGSAQDNWQSLRAGGVELRYTLNNRLAVQLQYAQRLSDAPSAGGSQRESVWLSLRSNF